MVVRSRTAVERRTGYPVKIFLKKTDHAVFPIAVSHGLRFVFDV
jgi:hypothetical protein